MSTQNLNIWGFLILKVGLLRDFHKEEKTQVPEPILKLTKNKMNTLYLKVNLWVKKQGYLLLIQLLNHPLLQVLANINFQQILDITLIFLICNIDR